MKRNKLMKASGILLALTLATSCFVGGTFAKYVSEGQGSDTARVAKWGVEVEMPTNNDKDNWFKTEYSKDDINSGVKWNTVISPNDDKVVAPGTDGTFGGIKITGTPEVAVKIQTIADVNVENWNVADDGDFYCPLVFTIGEEIINGLDHSSNSAGGASSFENAIKTAIEKATTREVEAGTDLEKAIKDITYSWEWPFEGGTGTGASQSDELDTRLGNKVAEEGNVPTISITVTTTVTQIN